MNEGVALNLIRAFEREHRLTLPGVDALAQRLEVRTLARRENAFRQGEPAPHVYFVREGVLKQQYVDEQGAEWIKSFAGPGELFACIHAIAHGGPARFASVAVTASVVERIDFRWIEDAAARSAEWQRAVRSGFQRLAELKVERERDLLMLKPRALYAKLAASSQTWLRWVPQKDLAAYLGVTAVGFNRIAKGRKSRR